MRHATDADHVIAVTTIVSRQRSVSGGRVDGRALGARAHADDPRRGGRDHPVRSRHSAPRGARHGVLRRDHAGPAGDPDADRRHPADPRGARGDVPRRRPRGSPRPPARPRRLRPQPRARPYAGGARAPRGGDAPGAARPHARALRRLPDPSPARRRAGPRARGVRGGRAAGAGGDPRPVVGDRVPPRLRGGDDRRHDADHRGGGRALRGDRPPIRVAQPPPRDGLGCAQPRLRPLDGLPDRRRRRALRRRRRTGRRSSHQ